MSYLSLPGSARQQPAVPRLAIVWGVLIGVGQAASPLAFAWLPPATVYALGLAIIASVYIGFAVADGRTKVVVVEISIAAAFVAIAAMAIHGSAWIVVGGLVAHGLKDVWQHRTRFVRNTRWWPPFCAAVDFTAAAILAVVIISWASFRA